MLEQQIIAQLYVLQSSTMNEKELNKQLLYIYQLQQVLKEQKMLAS